MAGPDEQHLYATLTGGHTGALVLAHSLRDAGTKVKLAVLVTLDSVSADSITQLKSVYDFIFPVPRIRNDYPANLYLMNRSDLHSAFTKINLWKFTEFSKIVYIDADVVAYRAPDELFSLPHSFSAAPDIGWPDLFNTGVMALTPNMGDYYALMAMAERGISFDGADQGLLNMHFGSNYNRLSFTYNVTPSAHYQYIPAYRHFQSSINMVHFIGSNKPWFAGRDAPRNNDPFNEMVGRWWAVYDRHYRVQETTLDRGPPVSEYVQYFVKGAYHPPPPPTEAPQPTTGEHEHHDQSFHQDHGHGSLDAASASETAPPHEAPSHASGTQAEARPEQHATGQTPNEEKAPAVKHEHKPPQITMQSWDAQRQPPPPDSKPEAINFPSTHYEMSQDAAPFIPPERYPSPPRNMWYEVPKEPPAPPSQAPPPIFPWERNQPLPSRSFVERPPEPVPSRSTAPAPPDASSSAGENMPGSSSWEPSTADTQVDPSKPVTSALGVAISDPWTSFQRVNAWDEVPEIERYVEGLQQHRRGKSQDSKPGGLAGLKTGGERSGRPHLQGFKVTDFPSELDRPSLPVTPAPIHRPSFWAGGDSEAGDEGEPRELPEAEGVPLQSEWDPTEQLQKLAKQQSEALLRKLEKDRGDFGDEGKPVGVGRTTPSRPLPFGSGQVFSLADAAQSGPGVLSPQPVKGEATTSMVRNIGSSSSDTNPVPASEVMFGTSTLPKPS